MHKPAIIGALIALVTGAAALPVTGDTTADITCPSSNGTTYAAADGGDFDIECFVDHFGGDLSLAWTDSFASCLDTCDGTATCVAVSYVGGACYMKSEAIGPEPSTNVWGAVKRTTSSSVTTGTTCPSADGTTVTEANGQSFNIHCGTDYLGGDLSSQMTDSFDSCLTLCETTTGCVALSWVGPAPGWCYMKSQLSQPVSNNAVWGAVLSAAASTTTTTSTTSAVSQTNAAASSSTSSSTSSSVTVTTGVTCPSSNGTIATEPSGQQFMVDCFVDPYGGDLSSALTQSFDACLSLCDSTTGCVGVSWLGPAPGYCYMKNDLTGDLRTNNAVWAAALYTPPVTSTTSSASPSTPITTTPPSSTDATVASALGLTPSSVSDASLGYGTVQTLASPITLSAAPTATLTPMAPPDVDMKNPLVLTPQPVGQVWYSGNNASNSSDSGVTTPIVRLNLTLAYPSILLDQSAYVTDVTCIANSTLTASFTDASTYNYAKSTWPSGSQVVLVTAASSCGTDGQNAFFVANAITFDDSSSTVTATGSVQPIANVLQNLDMDFGSITVTASNSSASSTDLGCGTPNATQINSLPAMACGADFDQALDDYLGYYPVDDADVASTELALAPGMSGQNFRRHFSFHSITSFVSKAVKTVVNTVPKVVQKIEQISPPIVSKAISTVASIASQEINKVKNDITTIEAIGKAIVTGNFKETWNFPVNLAPPSVYLTDSPWGDGFKFYTFTAEGGEKFSLEGTIKDELKDSVKTLEGDDSKEPGVDLWCVNCGVTGNFQLTGSFSASILHGFTQGQLSMNGNLYAGLFIGLDAFAEWDLNHEKDLFTMGLPGLSIPDIVALGPTLALGVSSDLDITAEGQFLLGASLTWPSISIVMNILDESQSSHSGFTPVLNTTVQSDATLTTTATLGLPVTLGFGLNVLNGLWNKEVKLVDTPGISATFEYDDDASYSDGQASTTPANGCYGITYDVQVNNNLLLDLSAFSAGTWTLESWTSPSLLQGCLGEAVSLPTNTTNTTTSSTSSIPTATTTTTSTSTSTPTPSPFSLLSFLYGTSAVTSVAQQDLVNGQSMRIDTSTANLPFTYPYGPGTAMGNTPASIVALYEYGSNESVFISAPNSGIYTIQSGSSSKTYPVVKSQAPIGSPIQIVAVVWGLGLINNQTVNSQLYNAAMSSTNFTWSNEFFGIDTWSGTRKSGVIFYTDNTGTLQYVTGIESTQSSFPTYGLIVDLFITGPSDQTASAKSTFPVGQNLVIQTNNLIAPFYDPWWGFHKSMVLLFTYGTDTRLWIGADTMGTVVIQPGPLSLTPNTYELPSYPAPPASASVEILAVVWGLTLITDPNVILNLYSLAASGAQFQWSNSIFGTGQSTSGVTPLSGAIIYKDANGNLQSLAGKQTSYASPTYASFPQNTCSQAACSYSNEVIQCTTTSQQYLLTCGPVAGVNMISELTYSSSTQCLSACVANSGCTGASYWADPNSNGANCFLYSPSTSKRSLDASYIPRRSAFESVYKSKRDIGSASTYHDHSLKWRRDNTTSLSSANSTYDANDTMSEITVTDTTGTLLINPNVNGSLFVSVAADTTDLSPLTNGTSLIADTTLNAVIGDDSSRLLYYFPQIMSQVGASRLRLGGWGEIPVGAQLVTLVPFAVGSDNLLVAMDTLGNYFFPFMCDLQGQLNKIFLVQDTDNGADILESPDLVYTVTGGVTQNCTVLALTSQGLSPSSS